MGWESSIAENLARLFPVEVAVCIVSTARCEGPLFLEEARYVERAAAKRRSDFAAGRIAGRLAMRRFGGPPAPITVGRSGEPVWPAGFVGSITHSGDFCCAAVARRSEARALGIDAEDAAPLERPLIPIVCRPEEISNFAERLDPPGTSWSKLAFSVKETVYKCNFALTRDWLDFHDISVRFRPGGSERTGTFEASIRTDPTGKHPLKLTGSWLIDEFRVYTAAASPTRFAPG